MPVKIFFPGLPIFSGEFSDIIDEILVIIFIRDKIWKNAAKSSDDKSYGRMTKYAELWVILSLKFSVPPKSLVGNYVKNGC